MAGEDYRQRLKDHIIICNCNEKVKNIVEELQAGASNSPPHVVLLVQDRDLWEMNANWQPHLRFPERFTIMYGCPTDQSSLRRAGIKTARAAIILADPNHGELADAPSTLTAMAIEQENPHVHSVMELLQSVNRLHLHSTEVNEIICLGDISEKLIAQSCISPGVKNIFQNLLTAEEGTPQIFVLPLPNSGSGKTYRELCRTLIRKNCPGILIGYVKTLILSGEKREAALDGDVLCQRLDDGDFNLDEKLCRRIIINPKVNSRYNKDIPLYRHDSLILIAHDRPDLQGYLLSVKSPELSE